MSRIGDRPGLTALARRHVRALRSAQLAGPVDSAPEWLQDLARGDWAREPACDARAQLLERARAHGLQLSSGYGWARIALVGFDIPDPHIDPWARAVVAALRGRRTPTLPTEAPVDALRVPDVTAEARAAAQLCTDLSQDTLILVSEVATARRVRDALRRNGVACAWRDTAGLHAHALASAVARCAPWFAQDDPPIRAADLAWVLGRTSLGQRLHPAAQLHLERRLAELDLDPDAARLTGRRVVQVIQQTRLLDAPLSRWLQVTEARDDPRVIAIHVRLEMLRCCIRGERLDDAFPVPGGQALDDFDDVIAQLLDDGVPGEAPPPRAHTLGALKAYLLACRVRVHDDPVAVAILAALKRRADWAASGAHVTEALSGSIDPGVVAAGVDVLTYDDYDGRPSDRLLLLDVHDKGLSQRPGADPLLDPTTLQALGMPSGRTLVDHRIAQAHRARAQAHTTLAIITQRDPGGREVVPPIQLDLRNALDDGGITGDPSRSHGLALALPEIADIRALEPSTGAPHPPQSGSRLAQLAIQATAEWYREGRGEAPPTQTTAPLPPNPTLADQLRHQRPLAPPWIMTYLGHAEGVPEATLPSNLEWSHSRLFQPLSHCLYQAWLRAVLGVSKADEIAEELDPREIGDAVHDALERVGAATTWRASQDALDDARDALTDRLRAATATAFADRQASFGHMSAARRASTSGQLARWNAHWPAYARTRVQREVDFSSNNSTRAFIAAHPLQYAALEALREVVPEPKVADYTLGQWLSWAAETAGQGHDLAQLEDDFLLRSRERQGALPRSYAACLRAFSTHPSFRRLAALHPSSRKAAEVFKGAFDAVAVEVPFGSDASGGSWPMGEVVIRLGALDTALRGRIDRIARVDSAAGPLLQITDYKTGRVAPSPGAARRGVLSLRDPQLVLYALATREAVRGGQVPEDFEGSTVAAIGYDHIRRTMNDGPRGRKDAGPLEPFLVDDAQLDHGAEALGWLLDEARSGRWTLAPRADTCPVVTSWSHDFCPYAGACRLRGLPPERGGAS